MAMTQNSKHRKPIILSLFIKNILKMKDSTCLVCKTEFYGRENQIFCCTDCKNKHYNVKNKLFYKAGKFGEGQIAQIQEQIYNNNDRIAKINSNYIKVEESYKAEIAELKADYNELLRKYETFEVSFERIRGRYGDALQSAKKLEEQMALLKGLGEMLGPTINKLTKNLGKMKQD
jgi:DNA repair exonuclease SbcCD ATPase subunit